MEILEQLEQRILQLLDNMSLMQMEIDELTDKNAQLLEQAQKSENLEAEVAKIRLEQVEWQNRLRHLLGRIDEVSEPDMSKVNSVQIDDSTTQPTINVEHYQVDTGFSPVSDEVSERQQTLL
ncbi:cell division protein ZapB [Thorsellia anophelis]|uniref:Cell division protein ZapB, interacts with FtsZ n=1 Tax=Thorsellia anophelis DSM 18579 TaxID=1123402 RepID=A0A1H9Y586_9GAMM|nr:cell division protein ZapB [Thorsellia anophelis]SES63955.1 Cell division protein ZapB, interacts with FtsZ [Thorsellia anophelis DSM 18579]